MQLTECQRRVAASLYESGVVLAVCRAMRVRLDDDLFGELGLKLCEIVQDGPQEGDTRNYTFIALCNRVRDFKRLAAQRSALLTRQYPDLSHLPQLRAGSDPSSLWDDPEAAQIAASGTATKPGNHSRKQHEINRARLARLRKEHGN